MSPAKEKAGYFIDSGKVLEQIQAYWLAHSIHDLSAPLSVTRGYLRMALEESDGSSAVQRRYLIKALEHINKLATLSRELNDFPKRGGLVFTLVRIKDLLQQAGDGLRPPLAARNLRLVLDTPDQTLCTIGDSARLAAALRGFLTAAVELCARGETIRVTAGEEEETIFLKIFGNQDPGAVNALSSGTLAAACRLWRLHGGSVAIRPGAEDGNFLTCELPVLRPSEC